MPVGLSLPLQCQKPVDKLTKITRTSQSVRKVSSGQDIHIPLMLCGVRFFSLAENYLSIYSKCYLKVCQENMGGVVLYPHSLLHLPSFSFSFSSLSSRSKLGKPFLSLRDGPLISSIRADGNRERPQKKASPEDSPRSSLSPNKEEILALFKRIQSSISKGDTGNSKKRLSRAAEDNKPSAESILEVLHQSRTRGKGKTSGRKGDKFHASRKDSLKKEEKTEHSSKIDLKSTRPPSTFTRRSPIPTLSIPRDQIQTKSETLSPTLTPSFPVEQKNESLHDGSDQQSKKFEEMKLPELKEVAKSKGIRGYSKLKKSELVELLITSLNNASP